MVTYLRLGLKLGLGLVSFKSGLGSWLNLNKVRVKDRVKVRVKVSFLVRF